MEYYEKYGKYPVSTSKDLEIKKLGEFIYNEKMKMRDKNSIYPKWKTEILEKYLPDFSCETKTDKSFNEFIYYAKLYKERYGHLNIEYRDVINGYNIGTKMQSLNHCKFLSEDQKKELEEQGVYLGSKLEKKFNDKMELAKQAIKDGVIIGKSNPIYKKINLYNWISSTIKSKYIINDLSFEEIKVVEKLVGKPLNKLYIGNKYNNPIKVKVIDILCNRTIGIFNSQTETARVMQEKYNVKLNSGIVGRHLTGKITTPYMDRFMFYRVDENGEVTE